MILSNASIKWRLIKELSQYKSLSNDMIENCYETLIFQYNLKISEEEKTKVLDEVKQALIKLGFIAVTH